MVKKVCFVTATRAEYGQMAPVMRKVQEDDDLQLQIIVTGTHLLKEYGYSVREIEDDGFYIDARVETTINSKTKVEICETMGHLAEQMSHAINNLKPDIIVILGDRYEMLTVASCATIMNIPIAHLSGGDSTPFAIDEAIRHAITKMSHLHFAFTEKYRNRILQMGENPQYVYNVGALGVENAKNIKLLSKEEIKTRIDFDVNRKFAILTFHSTTRSGKSLKKELRELIAALDKQRDTYFIITKANADLGGDLINDTLIQYASENPSHARVFGSLGTVLYFSLMRYASFIIGNSSSALVEAPSFDVGVINIGNRQNGRLHSDSVIDCEISEIAISQAIQYVNSKEYAIKREKSINPFEGKNTSTTIVEKMKSALFDNKFSTIKEFYDFKDE